MLEDTRVRFRTTNWSLLDALSQGGIESERARNRLVEIYWPAVYAYLRRAGHHQSQAAEIAQAFFSDVVFGRELFQRADRGSGRLRTFLLKSLKHYQVDLSRRAKARGQGLRVAPEALDQVESALGNEPAVSAEAAFRRAWARASLTEAIRRCEAHFRDIQKSGHWLAFEARVLLPSLRATTPPSYDGIYEAYGFRNPRDARAAVQTVKRRLAGFLEEVAAEAEDEGGLDSLAELLSVNHAP